MTAPVVTRQVNPHSTCTKTPTPIYTDVDMAIYYPYKIYSFVFSLIIYIVIIGTIIGSIIGVLSFLSSQQKRKTIFALNAAGTFKYKKKLPLRCPLCLSRLDPPECP